jgi:protein TonB
MKSQFYLSLLALLLSGGAVCAQSAWLRPIPVAGSVAGSAVPLAARPAPDSVYINPEVLPTFTGGTPALMAYLTKNMHYPDQALRQRLGGRVFVSFEVGADGRVQNVQVVRGVAASLDDEARRLVWLMPPWQPGQQQGQAVRTVCTIPIKFQP